MEMLRKIFIFVRNAFVKVPLYLRGIVIFAIFVLISMLLNKFVQPRYFRGNGNEPYAIINNKGVDEIGNGIEDEKVISGSLKSNLKVSAPVASKNMYSRRRKDGNLPDSLKYFWNDIVFGSNTAPITVVEFSSYNCPHCIAFQKDVLGLLKTNYIDTGKIRFVQRNIIQKDTLYAVMLPYCISSQELRYKLISDLYNNTKLWLGSSRKENEIKKIAIENNFSEVGYERCIADSNLANSILRKQKTDMAELNISSTPTLFINGKRQRGNLTYEKISEIIDKEYEAYIKQ